MKKYFIVGISLIGIILLMSSCAPANNCAVPAPPDIPGFFTGLWHGIILPVDFILSLFNIGVGIYAVTNNGHLYDFGFMVGIGILFFVILAILSELSS